MPGGPACRRSRSCSALRRDTSIPSARGRAASADLVAFFPRIRAIPMSRVHYYYHLVKDPEQEFPDTELPSLAFREEHLNLLFCKTMLFLRSPVSSRALVCVVLVLTVTCGDVLAQKSPA